MAPDGTAEHRHAVILAGGRGVRFWPRSRTGRPKQFLAELDHRSLLRQTADRLLEAFPPERVWVLTQEPLRALVEEELPEIPPERVVAEPEQRGTAPAIGLAALLLQREDPEAVMGVFPADHAIEGKRAYAGLLRQALAAADTSERLLVVGVPPRWPETGYGYLEFPEGAKPGSAEPIPIVRFREKPSLDEARALLATGRFFWNSGQFFWRATVFTEELRRFLPDTWQLLADLAQHSGKRFRAGLAERYGSCRNISVDRGILERSSRVAGFAAPEIGWNDVGSWRALHDLLPKDSSGNCARTEGVFLRSSGNYVDVPGKLVALLGVQDLVVVETPDALLICPRDEAPNVGAIPDALRATDRDDLL